MLSYPANKVNYWIDLADYDLKTAKAMLETKRFLYVGFMCHQVVEKVLKGFFVYQKNEVPPYTHNLAYLTELTGLNEELSNEQLAFIRELRPLNIESRYPENKDRVMQALDYEKCLQIYSETKELAEWIQKKLKS